MPPKPTNKEIPLDKSQSSTYVAYSVYVGKFDYTGCVQGYLSFKKGDLLYMISTDDKDWWFARLKETGEEGYVPRNYVAKYEQSLDTEK